MNEQMNKNLDKANLGEVSKA